MMGAEDEIRRGPWRDVEKERRWRRHVARQARSQQSVRAYCAAAGISEPSFYAWRRELAKRDAAAVPPAQVRLLNHPSLELCGIQQLVVAVADLEPPHVELEPLGHAGIVRPAAGQGPLRHRIVVQKRGPLDTQTRLHEFGQQQVEPAVAIVAFQARRHGTGRCGAQPCVPFIEASSALAAATGWPAPPSRCRPAAGSAPGSGWRFPWRSRHP